MKFIFKKSKKIFGDQNLKALSLHPLLEKAAFQKRLTL
jgi:hypothetical protein